MKVLFLSNWFPYPPINGAKIRIYNLIRELAVEHEIHLFAFARTHSAVKVELHTPHLLELCATVQVLPATPFDPARTSLLETLMSPLPRSVTATYSAEMEARVAAEIERGDYDVVLASEVGPPAAVSLLASRIKATPVILDGIEISVVKNEYESQVGLLRRARYGLTWMKLKNLTSKVVRSAAACTVPSPQELANVREIVGEEPLVRVSPHSLLMDLYEGPFDAPRPGQLIFTGSFTYFPNADAVSYFLDEIFPRIKQSAPHAQFEVLGSTAAVDLSGYDPDASIRFAGLVEDVRPHVAGSWLSVVPIRTGAGTRLKIVESMALGTPVVSTAKGAEGLAVTPGHDILIADEPDAFADAVIRVLSDRELRERLSRNGRALVEREYSAKAMGQAVTALMNCVAKG